MTKEKTLRRWNGSTAIAISIGSVPLMMALAPMSFSPDPAMWQRFVQFYSLIVPMIQFAIIVWIMREGGSVFRAWAGFPLISRIAVAVWIPLTLYTSFQPGNDYVGAALGTLNLFAILLFILSLSDRAKFVDPALIGKIWAALGIGVLAYSAVFAGYILANDIADNQWSGPYPGFHNIRHVAFVGLVAFAAGMYHAVTGWHQLTNIWLRPAIYISTVAGLIVVFWTGSRGPTLAIVMLTAFCVFLIPERRKAIIEFALATIAFSIAIVSVLPLPTPMFGVLAALGWSDIGSATMDEASSGRIEIWLGAIDQILEKPILGWGIDQFMRFNSIGPGMVAHPHNSVLQLLFACGFSGFVLFLMATLPIVARHFDFQNIDTKRFHLAFLSALLIYSFVDGLFYFCFPLMILALAFIGCLKQPDPDRSG